ncbi:MAG: energy transducer TonB [Prevotella sp.]
MHYLSKNTCYPVATQRDSIQGRVVVFFVVELKESVSNAEFVSPVGCIFDREALPVASEMFKYMPGKQNGKYYLFAILCL